MLASGSEARAQHGSERPCQRQERRDGRRYQVERREGSPGNWKTHVLDVHIAGHVILLKSIGKDQREVRTDFRPVPAGLSVAQAAALLESTVARNQSLPPRIESVVLHK